MTFSTARSTTLGSTLGVAAFGTLLAALLGLLLGARLGGSAIDAASVERSVEAEPLRTREITVDRGAVALGGTLTLPAGRGPFPAVVTISGAGAQDRDGVTGEGRDLARAFAAHGVASLRMDDRGTGVSTGDSVSATLDDLAADVEAAIEALRAEPEIAAVGLLGASQGAMIAADVAARRATDRPVAFVVLWSSPGLTGREVIVEQAGRLGRASGVPDATVEEVQAQMEAGLRVIDAPLDDEERRERLRPIVRTLRELQRTSPFTTIDARSVERELDALLAPSFRTLLEADPRPSLRRLDCPVLVVHGELDLQVAPEVHLPEIERALAAAPTDDVTVVRLPGHNHLLQPSETGLPAEYAAGRRSAEVYERTARWISERTSIDERTPR